MADRLRFLQNPSEDNRRGVTVASAEAAHERIVAALAGLRKAHAGRDDAQLVIDEVLGSSPHTTSSGALSSTHLTAYASDVGRAWRGDGRRELPRDGAQPAGTGTDNNGRRVARAAGGVGRLQAPTRGHLASPQPARWTGRQPQALHAPRPLPRRQLGPVLKPFRFNFRNGNETLRNIEMRKLQFRSIKEMEIFVKTIIGLNMALDVESSNTIEEVKWKIRDKSGYLPYQQCLVFAGQKLQDDRTLADYQIPNEATIFLPMLLRGG